MLSSKFKIVLVACSMLLLTACSSVSTTGSIGAIDNQSPDKTGYYSVHTTETPYSAALYCVDERVNIADNLRKTITVSYLGDESGKTGSSELEKAISQGGLSMMETALSRTGSFRIVPSYDRTVINREQDAALEDDTLYRYVRGLLQKVSKDSVKTLGTDYYISGAITSVVEHTSSAKAGVSVNNKGIKARTYSARIEMDVKIIDSVTQELVKSWPVAKTVTGFEIEAGIFSFIGDDLIDLELGYKTLEPRDMALRSIIEAITYNITNEIYKLDEVYKAKGIDNPCGDFRELRELRGEAINDPISKSQY